MLFCGAHMCFGRKENTVNIIFNQVLEVITFHWKSKGRSETF